MLKQQLKDELKQAMLAKDVQRTSVLRMVLSAIGYAEIQKGGAGYEATDEDVMAVIQKEAKQHKDSIEQFKQAGRDDLVEKEEENSRSSRNIFLKKWEKRKSKNLLLMLFHKQAQPVHKKWAKSWVPLCQK